MGRRGGSRIHWRSCREERRRVDGDTWQAAGPKLRDANLPVDSVSRLEDVRVRSSESQVTGVFSDTAPKSLGAREALGGHYAHMEEMGLPQ